MRYVILLFLLVLITALEASVLPYLRLNSGHPNLMLLVIVAWSIRADWDEGFFWAFVGGILQDLNSIAPLGTSVIPLLLSVFAVKFIITQVEGLTLLAYWGVVIVGMFVGHIVLFITLGLVGYGIDLVPTVRYFMLPSLIYQLVLALPIYWIVRALQSLFPNRRTIR
jgi:rod shape-determining protein MreD